MMAYTSFQVARDDVVHGISLQQVEIHLWFLLPLAMTHHSPTCATM
jgi:hypothetical protein